MVCTHCGLLPWSQIRQKSHTHATNYKRQSEFIAHSSFYALKKKLNDSIIYWKIKAMLREHATKCLQVLWKCHAIHKIRRQWCFQMKSYYGIFLLILSPAQLSFKPIPLVFRRLISYAMLYIYCGPDSSDTCHGIRMAMALRCWAQGRRFNLGFGGCIAKTLV